MANKTNTLEGFMMLNGKSNDIFYTSKMDKDITAIATYYKRKVNTERIMVISGTKEKPEISSLTKVTIL